MTKTFEDALKDFEKKYSIKMGKPDTVSGLPTGNLAIDWQTGVGGLPRGRITELYGYESSGKAQPLDAQVLTPTGYVKMGELRVGDRVVDPAGSVSAVTGVYPQGVQPVYRVGFSDGTTTEATLDHLWAVEVYVRGFGWTPVVATTAQMLRRLEMLGPKRPPRIRLPRTEPLEMESSGPLPVDPYLLGLLLGDGGLSAGSVVFTTTDPELLQAVRELSPVNCEVVPQSARVPSISWRIKGMRQHMRALGLLGLKSAAKFVPEMYKSQPATTRLALLQGLMDTDGHASSGQFNAGHGTAEFASCSRQLADDVLWLARSLGLKVVRGKTKKTFYKRPSGDRVDGQDSHRVRIYQFDSVRVFRLPRKLKPLAAGLHYNREVISIEYVCNADAQCISVSAPSKLYVTDDFIPTHNTTTALQTAVQLQQDIITRGSDERILYLDFEHALDGDYAESLGIDFGHPSFVPLQPVYLEQGANIALGLIDTGKVRMAVFDSVAAMSPKRLVDGEFDQATMQMHRAKLVSALCQNLVGTLYEKDCAAVFINHRMESIEMTGRPGMPPRTTTPGGRGLKYYASLRLEFDISGSVRDKLDDFLTQQEANQIVGQKITVRCVKNKVSDGQGRQVELRSRFGTGFDNAWSAVQVLLARKVIVRSGAWFNFPRDSPLTHAQMPLSSTGRPQFQGETGILEFADAYPEWRTELIATAERALATSVENE